MVGIVGAGGIGATLNTALSRYEYDTAAAILMIIIAIVMVCEYSSGLDPQAGASDAGHARAATASRMAPPHHAAAGIAALVRLAAAGRAVSCSAGRS